MRTEKKTFLGFHLFVCFSPSTQICSFSSSSSPSGLTISMYRLLHVQRNPIPRRPSVTAVVPFFPFSHTAPSPSWVSEDEQKRERSGLWFPCLWARLLWRAHSLPLFYSYPGLHCLFLLCPGGQPILTAQKEKNKQGKAKPHREVACALHFLGCFVGRGMEEAGLPLCTMNCTNNTHAHSPSLVSMHAC